MKDNDSHSGLGENVIPSRYRLTIEPNFDTFRYKGSEKITAAVKSPASEIRLNASELKIKKAEVRDHKGVHLAKIKLDKKEQVLGLRLKEKVNGDIEIFIEFEGYHNDRLYGFYRSHYTNNGKKGYVLSTQLEAANARVVFPCFDEPAFKSVFDLSLIVDKNLMCISNMPVKESKEKGKKKIVSFQSTPRMSTYLLYIGVGDFRRTARKFNGIEIGVVTVPGKEKYTQLPLDYAEKFLAFLEKYFGVKYHLPKLDLIAVPDFAPAGMENWGAIVFREIALLGDEKSSVAAKERIAEVIAHEFVHQWFGDLVTMKWWNDLWLNESFANFMSYKALEAVYPQWNSMTQYVANVVGGAFAIDQLTSTHPISVKVNTPGEIDEIFDEISYNKGGAVLKMIEGYVGGEIFRKGLNIYLKKNALSNSTKYDLWSAIEKEARKKGKNLQVSKVAQNWVDTKGYPALYLKRGKEGITILQKKFTLVDKSEDKSRWLIPVNAGYPPSKEGISFLMKDKEHFVKNHGKEQMKLNYHQTGFYRTVYPESMLENLGELIKGSEMEWIDAWGIENDLYALTKKGIYSLDYYLRFVSKYCFAAKYPLNLSVLSHLRALYSLFYHEKGETAERIRLLLKEYSAEVIKQVGWSRTGGEATITTKTRSAAVLASGISGDIATIHKAGRIFAERNKKRIEENMRSVIYNVVACSGGKKEFKILKAMYEKETVPEEKIRLLSSLGMAKDEALLKIALDFSLSDKVRFQDAYMIPAYVSMNQLGGGVIWKWTRKNWKTLMKRFHTGTIMLDRYVENLAAVYDPKEGKEIEVFFGKPGNMRRDLRKALAQTLEIMEINFKFVNYNKNMEGDE